MKRWFHKEDGGLIKICTSHYNSSAYTFHGDTYCSICGEQWMSPFSTGEKTKIALQPIAENTVSMDLNAESDWVPFFDLPENLQAAALAEML